VDSTNFSTDASGVITFTEVDASAIYTVTYTPVSGQDSVNLRDTFSSVELVPDIVFPGTDDRGGVVLPHYPLIITEIVNGSAGGWSKDPHQALWSWNPDSMPSWMDERIFGHAFGVLKATIGTGDSTFKLTFDTTASITSKIVPSSTATLPLTGQSGFIKLPNSNNNGFEWIKFVVTGNSLDGGKRVADCSIERGQKGTIAATHTAGATMVGEIDSVREYQPIKISVGGVPVQNRTDYEFGEHLPFLVLSPNDINYQFIHLGRVVYFDRPIPADREIKISYRYITEYVKVLMTMRCNKLGRKDVSPIIDNYAIRLRTSSH